MNVSWVLVLSFCGLLRFERQRSIVEFSDFSLREIHWLPYHWGFFQIFSGSFLTTYTGDFCAQVTWHTLMNTNHSPKMRLRWLEKSFSKVNFPRRFLELKKEQFIKLIQRWIQLYLAWKSKGKRVKPSMSKMILLKIDIILFSASGYQSDRFRMVRTSRT